MKQKIHYGPYEKQCEGGIPEEAVVKSSDDGSESWVLYIPTPKGKLFHDSNERYVLGEGGRGSGKSTTLRWDAHLRNLMIPGHRALLLRRTFPQLENSHFAQVMEEGKALGCKKDFNQTKHFLEYNNGSLLKFGHCASDADILSYLSQEWDWIGFDELTTFPYDQFIRISASARMPKSKSKGKRQAFIRAATNPIGEGASWVKRFFIDKSVSKDENRKYRPEEWRSIKMNLVDNEHMDREEYEQSLQMLGSDVLRRAYVDGEWLVEGQFFAEWKDRHEGKNWHVVTEMPLYEYEGRRYPIVEVPWIEITRAVDWGYSEAQPGYVAWIAHLPDGTYLVFKEQLLVGKIPEVAAGMIKERSEGMKVTKTMGDPMMWQEKTGESISHLFAKRGVSMYPANNDRENGWIALHSWLVTTHDDGFFGTRPRLQFLAPQGGDREYGAPYAIRTLPSLQTDPKNPRDMMQSGGEEDHAADAMRYWASNFPNPTRMPKKENHLPQEVREAIYGNDDSDYGDLR